MLAKVQLSGRILLNIFLIVILLICNHYPTYAKSVFITEKVAYETHNTCTYSTLMSEPPVAICKETYTLAFDYRNTEINLDPEDIDDGSYDPDGGTAKCKDYTVYLSPYGTETDIETWWIDNGSFLGCANYSDVILSVSPDHVTCDDIGEITVTLTAASGSDSDNCTSTVTVKDNIAPDASCKYLVIQLDENGSATISDDALNANSVDNCGIVSYSMSQTQFDCDDLGQKNLTMVVTDADGNTDQCTSSANIEDYINPVALCQDIDVYLDASGSVSITPYQIDNGSTDNCGIQSYSLTTSSFNCSHIGDNPVTLIIQDGNNQVSSCNATVTVIDEQPPTALCKDIDVYLDADGFASFTASDIDDGSSDACTYGSSASGISSYQLSTTSLDCDAPAFNTVTLTVTDLYGNSSSCTSTVSLYNNIAPTIVCQDYTASLDASGELTIQPSDLYANLDSNCPGALLSVAISQSDFDCSNLGTESITVSVSDSWANVSSCVSTLTIEDGTPPTAVCQDVTVDLDFVGTAQITANMIDAGSTDECPGGPTPGNILIKTLDQYTFDCDDLGDNTVTLSVIDYSQNTSTCTATVTVMDNQKPTVYCLPNLNLNIEDESLTIDHNDIDLNSYDNCDIVSYSLSQSSFDCSDVGINHDVVLTVTDQSGNSKSCTSRVVVHDYELPVAICQDITVTLDENGEGDFSEGSIDNGSYDNCGFVAYHFTQSEFDCSDVGDVNVTLNLLDYGYNYDGCTKTVTVVDDTAPIATCQNVTITLDDEGDASISEEDVDDNSSDACGLATVSVSKTDFDCDDLGTNSVTLTVVDVNGNTSTCTATVTVIDNEAPMANCEDINVELDVNGQASITADEIDGGSSDVCGFTLDLDINSFDCSHVGVNTVALTVEDASGNISSCTANVFVADNEAPVANCKYAEIYFDESGNAFPTVDDIDNGSSDACGIAAYEIHDVYDVGLATYSCGSYHLQSVNLTVTDVNGNSSTCNTAIQLIDNTPPTIYCFDNVVQIGSDASYSLLKKDVYDSASSFDNCTISSVSFAAATYTCNDIGATFAVEVTVTDESGNISTCTSNISVEENTALPEEWSSQDIGINPLENTYAFDPCAINGEYTITGSGNNAISSTTDNIAFAHQSLCGDGSIIAKVESISAGGYGGLMIRESTDEGAKQTSIFSNLSNILRHEVRYTTNGVKQVSSFFRPSPIWLKLERQGDWVFAYYSSTGTNFQYVHGVYLTMQNCVEIGLASFTYLPNAQTEAIFSYVIISGSNGSFDDDSIDKALSQVTEKPENLNTIIPPGEVTPGYFSLFPNPANNYFNVSFDKAFDADITLKLFSTQGQLLTQQIVPANTMNIRLEAGHLDTGTYYLVAEQNGIRMQAYPLIIAR